VYLRGSDRVEQVQSASYVIRCEGTRDGRRCGALLDIPLHEKAVCQECGWVSPSWSGYASGHRVVTKAVSRSANSLPCTSAEPEANPSLAPHPSSP